MVTTSVSATADATTVGAETEQLTRNAVGLGGVLMQALTDVAPAIAVLFTVQFTASQAGIAMPAAYVAAFAAGLPVAIILVQLARRLPSAGGWYTYVSRGLHPRAGFLVAWLYFLYAPLQTAISGTQLGTVFNSTMKAEWGFSFPWWGFMIILIVFVAGMAYRGISFSTRAMIMLGCAEMAIVGIFSAWGFFDSGPGGVTLSVFDPSKAPSGSGQGFGLAVIFAIFALNGWDGAAPLAEESKDPRRTVPRAVLIAITVMGAFLVFCSWGILSGWGPAHVTGFASSSQAPYLILAKRFWGSAGIPLLLLALLNSSLAVTIASVNVTTRMWYAMSRSGALPQQLSKLSEKYKTPVNALVLQTVISIVVGLGVAALVGPAKVFSVVGLMFTFVLIPVFILGGAASFFFYWREHRDEFNWFWHAVVPVIAAVLLIAVGYDSLHPAPTYPNNYALPICAIWLGIGIVVLLVLRATRKEDWFKKAGEAQKW